MFNINHISNAALNYFATKDLEELAFRLELILFERRLSSVERKLENPYLPDKLRTYLVDRLNHAMDQDKTQANQTLKEIEDLLQIFEETDLFKE